MAATPCQALVTGSGVLRAGSPEPEEPRLSAPVLFMPNPSRAGHPCSFPYALPLNSPPQPPGSLTAEVPGIHLYLFPHLHRGVPHLAARPSCSVPFTSDAAYCPCPTPMIAGPWPRLGCLVCDTLPAQPSLADLHCFAYPSLQCFLGSCRQDQPLAPSAPCPVICVNPRQPSQSVPGQSPCPAQSAPPAQQACDPCCMSHSLGWDNLQSSRCESLPCSSLWQSARACCPVMPLHLPT